MKQDSRKQEEEKFEKDVAQMPLKENLQELLTHKTAIKITQFLRDCNEEEQDCTLNEIVMARDYLITRVFIETMSRSGVVANLTIEDVLKAKQQTVNGITVFYCRSQTQNTC